ncbi:hypothetical protein T01_8759 [Trichinella spiralis]|uniref:Uncharacterized protein n=1 Tax=Trichinella spiralis TaxID=6334 RepID=A0A0V1B6M3_TRISP|nr:hypothetical protein T01_8759 [Trichinella spiralis]
MLNGKFLLQFDSEHINSHYSHLQINNQQYSTLNTVYENIPNSITIHFSRASYQVTTIESTGNS